MGKTLEEFIAAGGSKGAFKKYRLTASGPLFLPLSVSVTLFLALLSLSEHPALLLCQLLYLSASSSLLSSIPQLFYFFIFISCTLCVSLPLIPKLSYFFIFVSLYSIPRPLFV